MWWALFQPHLAGGYAEAQRRKVTCPSSSGLCTAESRKASWSPWRGKSQTEGRGRVTCYGVKGSRLEEGAQLACVWQDGIQTFLEGKGMCRAGEIVRGRDRWEMVPERQLLSVHIVILQMPLKGAIDHVVRRCLYVAVKCRSHGHCSLGRWNESSRMWWVPVWVESGGFWGLLKEANLEQSLRTSLFCSKLVYALTISIWRQPSTSFS